ncbi:hypothetical protein LOTGIDRAFT_165508 [Lottia gigantea]|uniref:Uncharacterized protein n=1 Tax=Lottia gigantea TaxID=225164 RepID=V4BIZ8_LOTGI|nr:hypothetical protein LOTGIDRAFT_165508 [Lottia gigantea]ESO88724.1 hypothetical protein LOTGIDRAFT_165508 [Lottia gigantea]
MECGKMRPIYELIYYLSIGTHPTVEDGTHPTVEDGIVDRMGCLSTHPTVEDGIVDRMGCFSMFYHVVYRYPSYSRRWYIVDRMGCFSTHPTVEDGIVDRIGCVSMFSSRCKFEYLIKIKNCSDYMIYNLKRTLSSDERFFESVLFVF